jgi:hypothetical protein
MGKTIIAAILVLIFCMSSSYAIRFAYEDFENYTAKLSSDNSTFNRTLFFTETNRWSCFGISPPNCVVAYGSPASVGASYGWQVSKLSPSGNHHLTLYAIYGDASNYYQVNLRYNASPNITFQPNMTFVHQFMLRLVSNDFGRLSGADQLKGWAGTSNLGFVIPGGSDNVEEVGRVITANSVNYSFTPSRDEPTTSTCDISDNSWHFITVSYITNDDCDYYSTQAYVDGILCFNATYTPYDYFCGTVYTFNELISASATFAIDLDNLSWYNTTQNATPPSMPPTPTAQCNDTLENDGDGFIDYPQDPGCSSPSDTTESPYNYRQCNDGIDNDGDGNTDLADICCYGNLTTPTETCNLKPSMQPEGECIAVENCLLNEPFPYTDNVTQHSWYGNASRFKVLSLLGSGKMYFDNAGIADFWLAKDITNANNFNTVQVWFDLSMATKSTWSGTTSSIFYVRLDDQDGKRITRLKFNLTQIDPLYTRCIVSADDGITETVIATIFPSLTNAGLVRFKLTIDQITKQYLISYLASGSWTDLPLYYDFYDATADKVQTFIIHDPYDSTKFDTYIDNINIVGSDVTYDTVCDVPVLPYYLQESFNGYLAVCGWSASNNIFFAGELAIGSDMTFYYAQKDFLSPANAEPLSDTTGRYFTVVFDLKLADISGTSNWELRLYDNTGYNFFILYSADNDLLYNANNEGQYAVMDVPAGQSFHYKVRFDFETDTYDIYFNGTKIVTGAALINSFYDLQNVQTIKISSRYIGFTMDDLAIYTSDAAANPLIGSLPIVKPVQNETSMCGLFYSSPKSCTQDSDCITGDCQPGGKCNSFDMTYCDKNGYTRGNYCYLAGITNCAGTSVAKAAFANFLWVLLAIVILMGVVYLVVMLRKGR